MKSDLIEAAYETPSRTRKENHAVAWGCGLVLAGLFILFLLGV